ncbi:sigma 54-interacting transcriptional regulator [Halobacillus shinanisalinarum]|uniref:Sigma 54-interacting transcriptional regulator n=1 Tax=Halobacillus shinanisalinarum TaxID=2932258 RepID=A0ABY4GWI0_9BACI|nr:sigma 54-interacting transcriptional regulator [Halobacillus shinanisalinarum]UOQ92356.1 sigma 54-interacting transcriptional regulator [Halobacillus shinanisalinarum]
MLEILENYRDGILETIFGNVNHCVVVVDRDGFVSYMNDSYCDFLEVDKKLVPGKHVTEVIENTRMHLVVQTEKEEIADLQYIRGNYMIAHRIPLRADGKVVGALGMVLFRDTEEWLKLNSHIRDLLLELETYRNQMKKLSGVSYSLHDIVSSSSEMHLLKDKIKKVAPGNVSVLLRGESGTGKELFAHSIHHLSERNTKPFVKVNCAAIPEHLLESELFGYQEGAFTGAKKGGKPGKFQLANGGTLFLDEIGDMPLQAQVKILRVLQEGEMDAIGSVHPQKVDVRIIAATNQPLEGLIEVQKFREDLFYRINVVQVDVPPLRKRPEDLRVLAKYLLEKVTQLTGKRVIDFEETVYDCFLQYHWPGNVRELENVIEAAVHLTSNEMIELDDLPDHIKPDAYLLHDQQSLKAIMETTERQVIERTLKKVQGDKTKAAELLRIGKSSLYDKVKKYGL